MSVDVASDIEAMEAAVGEVARHLKALAHEKRLLVLCKLLERGEANVGELTRAVGLSQSALSQHLAMMREEGLVATRREGQTIHYRIADPRLVTLLGTLRDLFCPPPLGRA